MLEALIKYNDTGVPLESGYKPKDVHWAICCDEKGDFLDVIELGDVSLRNNRGQEFLKCPDFSFSEMKAQGIIKSHSCRIGGGRHPAQQESRRKKDTEKARLFL
jgi:hypothetical protein